MPDAMTGSRLIVQDTEHSLATGIPEVVSSLSAALESIGTGQPRPGFDYTRDEKTGALTVTVPAEHRAAVDKVVLRHAETVSKTRRDFRCTATSTSFCHFGEILAAVFYRCAAPSAPCDVPLALVRARAGWMLNRLVLAIRCCGRCCATDCAVHVL